MRTLRLLLAVGLGLAATVAAAAAGATPALAGGGAGMTLTATMDGQDQRLLVGTRHVVHITLADTPGEADLRDISITLNDLDPRPMPVVCPGGQDGHLSLEPNESLHCTAVVTAAVGYRTLLARATAHVPSLGTLLRTDPLHYDGFMPPPPPAPDPPADQAPVRAPLTPDPVSTKPRPPVFIAPPPPAHVDPPKTAPPKTDPPKQVAPPELPATAGCAGAAAGRGAANVTTSGSCAKPVVKRDGLAFTGMSTPMLTGAAGGGLLLVGGGLVLIRRFARR